MIDLDRLAAPMSGDGCRAEQFEEKHRELLKAACAEDAASRTARVKRAITGAVF